MGKIYDVIIAGAGPIGLFIACELGLARTSVLVLERDLKPDSPLKGEPLGFRGLNTPSVEAFYRRGLLNKLFDPSQRPSMFQTSGFQRGGHFGGLMLNSNKLELDRWKYRLNGPALVPGPTSIKHIETVLTERAESLGVTILRGNGVTDIIAQDDESVTVEAGENQCFRGKWLVGCDGGRSVIRKAAGFDFVGTEAKFIGYVIQCDLNHPEKLKMGFNVTKTGMYIKGLPGALYLLDFDDANFDRTKELTQEHMQEVLNRITCIPDLKITKFHLASSYTDRSKQATAYRKGRILLAGDAAHIHPPFGAQGLNLGLADAVNLGWKLGATVRREYAHGSQALVNLDLLDTYESERHPFVAKVIEFTQQQTIIMQPNVYGAAMRSLISDIIDTTDGANLFMDRFWGLSQRYALSDKEGYVHPAVGCSAPDFELNDGSRLGSKLEGGRGLLLDFEDDAALKELIADRKYEAKIDYVSMSAKDKRGLRALLIRPDGIVAWAVEDNVKPDIDTAKAALGKWFGF